MTHYSWTIQAAEDAAGGDLRPVYLSLHGLRSATAEIALPAQAYEPGSILSGVLDVQGDLGELQTGTLRTDESASAPWSIGWVRVMNLRDGRQWTARGGICDADGSCPILRFVRTRGALGVRRINAGLDSDANASANGSTDRVPVQPALSCTPDLVQTYEVFGTHRGRVAPLTQILHMRAGVKKLLLWSRIWIATDASQGFGLAGMPGKWEELYPGVSPAAYGLDPDKPVLASDGVRAWVLDAHYLAILFGAEWRRVVYGN